MLVSRIEMLPYVIQVMPHVRVQPLAQLWDMKAQKNGLRPTVYSVNGHEYTGEWKDNKKHGKRISQSLL